MLCKTTIAVAALLILGSGMVVSAQDRATETKQKVTTSYVYRASTITGMKVLDTHNERVGTIEDLVLDVREGNIRYAALAVGGFLGIGEKLFAVPWHELRLKQVERDHYFVIDIDKEKLRNAPGFDKNHWPDVADPNFAEKIDKYYQSNKDKRATRTSDATRR